MERHLSGSAQSAPSTEYRALLAGATGLVGSSLLRKLLAHKDCRTLTVLTRRPLDGASARIVTAAGAHAAKLRVIVADFDRLGEALSDVEADVVYCALGTTIRKARTKEAFRMVDFDYPLALGEWAKQRHARKYVAVTAMGASTTSPFFYSRVKGELEEELAELRLPELHLFRPSLLLGKRQEVRLAELLGSWAAIAIRPLMLGGLRRYRPIGGDIVAEAMLRAGTRSMAEGVYVYNSSDTATLGTGDNDDDNESTDSGMMG
ncbi:Semialdehyde dehydrogenase NAD - binding [Paenibacillus curdlanolyticus YK9]|uniref:Semialdehyde dehydrogenase NAD-binding n=1 Tax=Paenibacillus curdlanolyticus YK9 TaxID=717606 RepID=E0I8U0_9BACL|nr:NAD-dependent epimerase/dehydratase family protein [Paenibacillus curdlanolyticus]EFM10824.1 Semialdehyde dehydrogenase NAD - binding [Paenibacillus curdlanolyticus YK9]